MNYAKIMKYDIGNWDGITTTIFFSGCTFHCPGCFNAELQDFNYGELFTKEIEDLFISYSKSNHVSGVCILGGEPFQQDMKVMINLFRRIKEEVGKPIHVWTGYLLEDLLKDPSKREALNYIDTLVDGPFMLCLKNPMLKYRGSSNQRVIDIPNTLLKGEIVHVE